jgi:hypothetical protein
VEEAHHRVGDKKVEEKSVSTIDIYGRGSSSRGRYKYGSRVPEQEKPRMSRLPVTHQWKSLGDCLWTSSARALAMNMKMSMALTINSTY